MVAPTLDEFRILRRPGRLVGTRKCKRCCQRATVARVRVGNRRFMSRAAPQAPAHQPPPRHERCRNARTQVKYQYSRPVFFQAKPGVSFLFNSSPSAECALVSCQAGVPCCFRASWGRPVSAGVARSFASEFTGQQPCCPGTRIRLMHPMLNIAVKAARRAAQIINRASLDLDLHPGQQETAQRFRHGGRQSV